jgi:hypothetical protein
MFKRGLFTAFLIAVLASLCGAASSGAAGPPVPTAGPPLPTAADSATVEVIGTGVPTPTAFAFAGQTVFAGSGPDESTGGPGGLFVVSQGAAKKIPHTPPVVFGLAWRKDKLYVSTGPSIVALGGWNGTSFSSSKTIYAGKGKGFPGFNGLSFGPEGRLYAGLALDEKYDHAKDPFSPSQAVVSMTAAGKDLEVVTEGLRQPFQLAFPQGSKFPYVTVLGQDKGKGPVPDDEIVVAKRGQDYGFPTCTWLPSQKRTCKGYDRPLISLPPHASPMGIGSIGKTLYVSLFGGTGHGPEVVSIPVAGGGPKPFMTGFGAPVIALGVNKGSVYVGDLTGSIYKVAAN